MTEGPWRVEVSSPAQRDLARLPGKVTPAIVAFITGALADNPHRVTKALGGQLAGLRSARRGDYRVLVEIVETDRVVLVVRIDHRAHAYRPR